MDQINLIDITLLLSAAQGLFLVVFLLHKHRKPVPNRFLILLIFSYSFILLQLVTQEMGVWDKYPQIIPLNLGMVFIMLPAHYYYSIHLTRPSRNVQVRDLIHLLPFVLLEGYQGIGLLVGKDATQSWFEEGQNGVPLFNIILFVYALAYMALTLVRLRRHAKASTQFLSNQERIHFRWLQNLTWLTISVLMVFVLENLLLMEGVALSQDFNLSSFMMAVFVYAIGYQCFIHPEVLEIPEAETRGGGEVEMTKMLSQPEEPAPDHEVSPKYQKSGLNEEKAEEIRSSLLRMMEKEELFRDPDLTLNELADHLEVSPHNLSEVINTRLEKNFFDFVNGYRIEQVKRDILNPDKRHLKMLALAFDAGFRSKSSFNLLFKKHVGMTPSEFRKKQRVTA